MPTQLVEVGFDLVLPEGPFFTLDDPTKGALNNTSYPLAGFIFYDITEYVTGVQVTRGKSDDIDTISSGELVVTLNNRSRAFDPLYAASPFYGNILPKRQVRYSANGIQQYSGVIDDWNLGFTVQGDADASFVASDGFVYLNNQTLATGTATPQLTGARITSILDDPFVQWPTDTRQVDTGHATLGADVIPDNQNVLNYLQQIEQAELGLVFIGKTGDFIFKDRNNVPSTENTVKFSDDGTGIAYEDIQIVYGSENLVNEVVASSVITSTEITATDDQSQQEYGIFNATLTDLLLADDAQVENLAVTLLAKYSQPVYRFSEVTVRLNDLTLEEQNSVLNIELGDFVQMVFTPGNIPPAINKYAQVIRANHDVSVDGQHVITFGLNTLNVTYLVLDDTIFGRLDEGNALSF